MRYGMFQNMRWLIQNGAKLDIKSNNALTALKHTKIQAIKIIDEETGVNLKPAKQVL